MHPEHAGKVKADALNNAKRVFKTILSIHRRLPYAVIPLDTQNIKIDFEAAKLPLKSTVIEQAAAWYKSYDTETHFQDELKPYYEEVLAKYNRESYTEIKISNIALKDTEKFPPCIQKILNAPAMPTGKTRATAIIAAFLGQAGWNQNEAHELYMKVVNTLHADTSNVFESWYKKMSCPSCHTMKEKGGSFPCVSMGDVGICVPDLLCKSINNPIQYITSINGNRNGNTCGICKFKPKGGVGNCRHPDYRNEKGEPRHYTVDTNTACEKFAEKLNSQKTGQGTAITDTKYFEDGRFRVKILAEEILTEVKILTVEGDPEDMYYYSDGIYKTGASEKIKTIAQAKLGMDTTEHYVNEVVFYIQNVTLIPREKLFGEWFRINLKNGIYNVLNKELEPHSPDKITIIQIPVIYDPQAKCPQISKFLCEALSPENIPLITQIAGYCLIPRRDIQKAIMLNGVGGNGKGTFARLLTAFLGKQNVSVQSLQELNTDKFSRVHLFGKLANICGDIKDTAVNDDDVFKKITGVDTLSGQNKFQNAFDFG